MTTPRTPPLHPKPLCALCFVVKNSLRLRALCGKNPLCSLWLKIFVSSTPAGCVYAPPALKNTLCLPAPVVKILYALSFPSVSSVVKKIFVSSAPAGCASAPPALKNPRCLPASVVKILCALSFPSLSSVVKKIFAPSAVNTPHPPPCIYILYLYTFAIYTTFFRLQEAK